MISTTMNRPWAAVLLGGGIAATLDLVYAFVRNGMSGRTPFWVLQLVASGWTGSHAFESGLAGGFVGLVSHYSILLAAAALYWLVSAQFPVLRSRAAACGALFGVLVYLFMNFVVLPLSAFPFELSYPLPRLLEGFLFHAVLVGMPIAYAARQYSGSHQERLS